MDFKKFNDFSDFIFILEEILAYKSIPHKLSKLSKFNNFLKDKQNKFNELMKLKIADNNCPQLNNCTSCDYKKAFYNDVLEKKYNLVKELFFDFEKQIEYIVPSPKPFAYRRRAQFHIKNKKLGYHKRGTNELVEIKHCPLLTNRINDFLAKENFIPSGKLELEENGTQLSQRFIEERGNSFSQINESVNTLMKLYVYKLIKKIKEQNKETSKINILELYGGSGNFIEYLFKENKINKIVSVDISAENGIKENGKIRFVKQGVGEFLKSLLHKTNEQKSLYDIVLLDPPRKGIELKNLEKLLLTNPKYIIYIACEQNSLKSRVEFLLAKGWKHKEFILFDMFPFTKHIESISLFENKS